MPGINRWHSPVIWICGYCHDDIHKNPEWAYKMGYLVKINFEIIQKMKNIKKDKKNHDHNKTKTINDFSTGKLRILCTVCNQEVPKMNFGTHKEVEAPKTTSSVKIGYEKQDPRILKAELLKRRFVSLKRIVNSKMGSPDEIAKARLSLYEVKKQMLALEKTYEE